MNSTDLYFLFSFQFHPIVQSSTILFASRKPAMWKHTTRAAMWCSCAKWPAVSDNFHIQILFVDSLAWKIFPGYIHELAHPLLYRTRVAKVNNSKIMLVVDLLNDSECLSVYKLHIFHSDVIDKLCGVRWAEIIWPQAANECARNSGSIMKTFAWLQNVCVPARCRFCFLSSPQESKALWMENSY